MFKEGRFEEARSRFVEAMNTLGYQPELAYNIALSYYKTKQFGAALKHLAEIIERGVREHPELKQIISDFTAACLFHKPDDVYRFAFQHFKLFAKGEMAERLKARVFLMCAVTCFTRRCNARLRKPR